MYDVIRLHRATMIWNKYKRHFNSNITGGKNPTHQPPAHIHTCSLLPPILTHLLPSPNPFFTYLPPGIRCCNFKSVISEHILWINFMGTCTIAVRWMSAMNHLWWLVNIGSSNGSVPAGNKSFPEPMLTGFMSPYGLTRRQWVNLSLFSLYVSPSRPNYRAMAEQPWRSRVKCCSRLHDDVIKWKHFPR